MRHFFVTACLIAVLLPLGACTTVLVRFPVPQDQLDEAMPYGIDAPFIRYYADELSEELEAAIVSSRFAEQEAGALPFAPEIDSIAFSGGGPDGAFGAGLMSGWTKRGDRPSFRLASGVSTGAIIALYAFLGPEYDDELTEIYTSYETDDLVTPTIFAGLTGGTALTSTRGYRALIEDYISPAVVDELETAHQDGRFLFIGTTNIDASRPVIWNLTAIAASGHPERRRLIHDVIQASSAIPAAFPPVIIPVETPDGRKFDEMHVDGGATQQVLLYSPAYSTLAMEQALGVDVERRVWVVFNNKLRKAYDPVRPRLLSIAGRAASSLIGGSSTGDLYRIFAITERDDMELNVVAIPQDFDLEAEDLFDPVYMQALYDLGFEYGETGKGWLPHPPDFSPLEESAARIQAIKEGQGSLSN